VTTGRIAVRVHPGAKRTALVGWMEDGTLKLSVAAPPEGGRANAAVTALLAEVLDVKSRQVAVARGLSSRTKWVDVAGLDEAAIRRRIDQALQRGGAGDGD
jgi:uncharacterized protein